MGPATLLAKRALENHMKRFRGQLMEYGTFSSGEFDRLYLELVQARWDEGDVWVRSVWTSRPTY